jgi:hypothetical protein
MIKDKVKNKKPLVHYQFSALVLEQHLHNMLDMNHDNWQLNARKELCESTE